MCEKGEMLEGEGHDCVVKCVAEEEHVWLGGWL